MAASYTLRMDLVYNNTASATTAVNNINNVLAGWTDPVTTATASRTSATVDLFIADLTEDQVKSLAAALITAWSSGSRVAGRVGIARKTD